MKNEEQIRKELINLYKKQIECLEKRNSQSIIEYKINRLSYGKRTLLGCLLDTKRLFN